MDERLGIMGILLQELLRLAGVTLCSDIIRCDAQNTNVWLVGWVFYPEASVN